jgi:O-acetylhomoserine (thiol)-lyase
MDAAALAAAGVGEELIRISVGLEAAGDIIDDFGHALRAAQKA